MTLEQALQIVHNNQHLKGMDLNGVLIDDLLILPTDQELRDVYMGIYIRTLSAVNVINSLQISIDVDVIVIFNKAMIYSRGMILERTIDSLPDNFNVKL
ncbi:hypothetical protein SAMN05421741_11359 [Paenimyroides ummariense]|uniref:Uncharacterized protein n=1 Tax=Paenimyroides ummariense TaxID=913024 RepID=A0A1I5CTX7_9FLAO|nr:hypothetical protein [Paenimyroides ummariense]SFN90377.1 hypothetical protein SAMN05421741_11359 [Paenimyroides ummariense]